MLQINPALTLTLYIRYSVTCHSVLLSFAMERIHLLSADLSALQTAHVKGICSKCKSFVVWLIPWANTFLNTSWGFFLVSLLDLHVAKAGQVLRMNSHFRNKLACMFQGADSNGSLYIASTLTLVCEPFGKLRCKNCLCHTQATLPC